MVENHGHDEQVKDGYTQLVFECSVCQKTYKNPGMCQACHVLLKPRGG